MSIIKAYGQNSIIQPESKLGSMTVGTILSSGDGYPSAGQKVIYFEHDAIELDFYGRKVHTLWNAKLWALYYDDPITTNEN